jgi:hypothetical protein
MSSTTLQPAYRAQRPRIVQPTFEAIDSTAAELSALVVDLAARARHRKLEGLALPLLRHARTVRDRLDDLVERADAGLEARFAPQARELGVRLDAIDRTIAYLQTLS